jgi:hypothetical protein
MKIGPFALSVARASFSPRWSKQAATGVLLGFTVLIPAESVKRVLLESTGTEATGQMRMATATIVLLGNLRPKQVCPQYVTIVLRGILVIQGKMLSVQNALLACIKTKKGNRVARRALRGIM